MLTFGTQVRGYEPGRNRRIFQGEKILSMPSFGGEVKPSVSLQGCSTSGGTSHRGPIEEEHSYLGN
jgi:hypothetical protein